MDAEVIRIFEKLKGKYPVELVHTDYPILSGTSQLGKFEMFFDDVPSFAFYATHHNGEFLAHWHEKNSSEAEKAVVDFLEGKLTIIQFGQPNNI